MTHLIDKDAVVADIENLENTYKKCPTHNSYEEGLKDGRLIGYKDALYKINTLEVKDVDFERELSKCVSKGIHRFFPNEGDDYYNMDSVVWQDYVIETAKHFFELGLKAQKGDYEIVKVNK